MKDEGILNRSNEQHLAALHYVYLSIINRHLMLFTEGHNKGPISTEQNQSPEQMWFRGMLSNSSKRIAEEFSDQVNILYSYHTQLLFAFLVYIYIYIYMEVLSYLNDYLQNNL